jgi:alanine racemase
MVNNLNVRPFFTIKAHVAYFKVVEAGVGISYGHTYHTQEKTRIITVPVGYGDGYRRALSNKAEVLVGGRAYPVIGTICMDQFMVDLGWNEAYVGDEVVLIGSQGDLEIRLEDLARKCDTIPYELLCGFNDRLPRVYLPS